MKDYRNELLSITTAYMPDGSPAPYVLTAQEAIRFLRIDTNGSKHPETTLEHYQKEGLLVPITIGKCRKYPLPELLRFVVRFVERLSQLKENMS